MRGHREGPEDPPWHSRRTLTVVGRNESRHERELRCQDNAIQATRTHLFRFAATHAFLFPFSEMFQGGHARRLLPLQIDPLKSPVPPRRADTPSTCGS